MKKIFFSLIFIAMCMFAINANAQVAYQKTEAFDNTYVGVNAGVTTSMSFDHLFPLNPTFGLKVGKNFNTVVGMNVEGTAWFGSHGAHNHHFDIGDGHNAFRAVSVGLNGTVNLTNAILGYYPDKVFEVYTETGLGWLHTFNANMGNVNDLYAKGGVVVAWNLGKKKAWQIYAEPEVRYNLTCSNFDLTHGVKFNKNHAQVGLSIGAIYKFKTSNGTHNFKVYNVGDLYAKIAKMQQDLDKKPREVVKVKKQVETKVVKETIVPSAYVFFAQNSFELTDEAKATLDNVAGTVEVVATASPEGTEEYNLVLSQRRADTVKEYLESKGVKVLKAEGLGVQGNASNRVSIVTIK